MTFGKGCHLHLIDGSAFIFRAYHALPPLTRKSDGLPVGAVAGFCNMLFRYVENNKGADAATHVAVIFDHSSKTFRNEIYPLYKAHRPDPPEEQEALTGGGHGDDPLQVEPGENRELAGRPDAGRPRDIQE